jgi:flagellar biosynthesis/type III secretory pathway M-ring protein FliF/YscJ
MNLGPDEFDFGTSEMGDDLENLHAEKSKLIMDFGLDHQKPERVTIEVLKRLIRDKPEKMSQAIRQWMHPDRPAN